MPSYPGNPLPSNISGTSAAASAAYMTQIHISMLGLVDVMVANMRALHDMETSDSNMPRTKMHAGITRDVLNAAMGRSPFLYGVLMRAHRGEFEKGFQAYSDISKIYIDPNVVHPILGGRPVEYGATLHNSGRPWFVNTARFDAPGILDRHGAQYVIEIEEMYK